MKEKLTIALLKEAKDGNMGSNEVYTMTRSEAIERMAKALKKVIYILSEEACIEGCEAALNALLEGHDDER